MTRLPSGDTAMPSVPPGTGIFDATVLLFRLTTVTKGSFLLVA